MTGATSAMIVFLLLVLILVGLIQVIQQRKIMARIYLPNTKASGSLERGRP